MFPVEPRFPDPDPPWRDRFLFAVGGAGVVLAGVLLAGAEGLGLVAAVRLLPPHHREVESPVLALLGLTGAVLHLVVLPLVLPAVTYPLRRLMDGARVGLRRYRARCELARHRARLPAYFVDGAVPRLACRLTTVERRPLPELADPLLSLLAAVSVLEATLALATRGGSDSLDAFRGPGILVLGGLAVVALTGFRLDRERRRMAGLGVAATLVLIGVACPATLSWGPGALPVVLVAVGLAAGWAGSDPDRDPGAIRSYLFLTTKGVTVVEFKGDRMREGELPPFRPERLTLEPGPGGSRWELWTSGLEPLVVDPEDGDPSELARHLALVGSPVRVTGQGGMVELRGFFGTHGLAAGALGIGLSAYLLLLAAPQLAELLARAAQSP